MHPASFQEVVAQLAARRLLPVPATVGSATLSRLPAAHQARAESASGDAAAINARMERHRIRRGLCIAGALAIVGAGAGCSFFRAPPPDPPPRVVPATVVIPADRWQHPMTNSAGVVGWFVPAVVHAEMMEAVALVDYYRSQTTQGTDQ